jgi:SAM-dependent methyltransferase
MMEHIPLPRAARVLEVGSGDGYQLELLRRRFEHVFALDLGHCPKDVPDFAFASAEHLPFPDQTFDLVTSNCVLEHVHDRQRARQEILRVLRPGGYVAHVVPTRFWKATSVLLNPVGYPLMVCEKAWAWRAARPAAGKSGTEELKPAPRPDLLQVLGRWISPPIHGAYPSHLAEYRAYAPDRWAVQLSHLQLRLIATPPTLCYTPFGFARFRGLRLRQWLAQHGFASSRAFIWRKIA